MKKIVLWQIIASVIALAAFFIGYRIEGLRSAFVAATVIAVPITAAIAITTTTITADVTTVADAAAIIAAVIAAVVVTITLTLIAPNAAPVTAFVVGFATFTIAVFAADFKKGNKKISFFQIIGSYIAEVATLYGIMAGFLHGMVLMVWLPTLIAAIVSAVLFAVGSLARRRTIAS